MVPRILTHDQKQRRLHISSDHLCNAEMFDRVITGDETWCFQYDPETKWQSMQWKTQNSPRPKKARISRSQVKTMLVCVFDHNGIVRCDFIAQGQTVNWQCYLEVLARLWESVCRRRPGLLPDKCIFHHDNAPAHVALRFCEFLAINSITKMDHPSYSPDLAPCDFLALSKIKKCPEGTKICRPFWHPTQREKVTVRYCGKWFSRLFPAVAPLSHKVHSFTRQVFRRQQQLLVHK